MICGFEIMHIARCLSAHFLLSFVAASLVWWLTSTIYGEAEQRTRRYLCLASALVVHVLQDYYGGWF